MFTSDRALAFSAPPDRMTDCGAPAGSGAPSGLHDEFHTYEPRSCARAAAAAARTIIATGVLARPTAVLVRGRIERLRGR